MARNKQTDEIGGGKRGPGRPTGSQNKVTRAAKEAIALAAENLGGVERLTAWAQESPENERAFWVNVYPKLIPVTLAGDSKEPMRLLFGWAK